MQVQDVKTEFFRLDDHCDGVCVNKYCLFAWLQIRTIIISEFYSMVKAYLTSPCHKKDSGNSANWTRKFPNMTIRTNMQNISTPHLINRYMYYVLKSEASALQCQKVWKKKKWNYLVITRKDLIVTRYLSYYYEKGSCNLLCISHYQEKVYCY